jgi:hypothetical protein
MDRQRWEGRTGSWTGEFPFPSVRTYELRSTCGRSMLAPRHCTSLSRAVGLSFYFLRQGCTRAVIGNVPDAVTRTSRAGPSRGGEGKRLAISITNNPLELERRTTGGYAVRRGREVEGTGLTDGWPEGQTVQNRQWSRMPRWPRWAVCKAFFWTGSERAIGRREKKLQDRQYRPRAFVACFARMQNHSRDLERTYPR